ncbi:hypothetical protein OIU83_09600 [Flavobacterium sp. LS1R49]|uniref:Uncharacterized protein n=1 Tax=Flavobacterium shii TaxID=2987687 RepID=A0A9X2ZDS4_9FLAO|nr:hypothetical protein [Flavobacterium shii]MCV9927907.1 hypothetical protein [Flavobacterium shii]
MFINLTNDNVEFHYKSKRWKYAIDEIVELGILKKKKKYLLENGAFIIVTVFAYYCMLFSNLIELHYILPTILFYAVIIILRFHDSSEFEYYVIVRDIYKKEIKIKIKALDKRTISKQIDQYLSLKFNLIVHKSA